MNLFKTRAEIRAYLDGQKNKTIGFVPTMGALHEGHLSLVKRSKETTHITVVSIFVNPTQFNDPADLEKYPRNPGTDIELLDKLLEPGDIIFMPANEDIYEDETLPDIDLGNLDKVMEGESRPGHFIGVVRVVNILFDIVKPRLVFFGQKDFQQLAIIRLMVKQLGLDIEIISCPIIREENGLAMSSRNERLSPELREKAGMIFQSVNKIREINGPGSVKQVSSDLAKTIDSVDGLKTEYFVIVDGVDLNPVDEKTIIDPRREYYGCVAVFAGDVRLIDNVEFSFPV